MKKFFLLFLVITFVGVALFFFAHKKKSLHPEFKIITYHLERKDHRLLVADTKEKREKGLMNYRTLPDVDGMIFLFPKPEYQSFWNKNTYLDLDIYWVKGDKVIGRNYLPSIEETKEPLIVQSPGVIDKVIEIVRK